MSGGIKKSKQSMCRSPFPRLRGADRCGSGSGGAAAAAPAAAAAVAVAVAVGWRWLSGRSQPRSQHGGSALLELELMSLTDKADEVVPFGPSRVGQNGLVWSERFGP